MRYLTFLMILGILSCNTAKRAYLKHEEFGQISALPEQGLVHKAYLIGDAGGLDDYQSGKNYVFEAVERSILEDTLAPSLVFLGDNLYPSGLSDPHSQDRKREEQILNAHIALAKANKGQSYVIPGNHDWNDARSGGRKTNKRQYDYIKAKTEEAGIKYLPKKSCGDPEVVKINKDLVYLFIDSQWWLQKWDAENNMNKGCDIKSRRAFADEIKDLFLKYKNKQIVVYLHHPFKSNGHHGAKFSAKDHVFPLTNISKYAYVPLPGIGSLMPIARKLGITRQDNTHPLYKELHDVFLEAINLSGAKRIIFASGHDHNLQYFKTNPLLTETNIHYLVSGSGYKESYARKGSGAEFVYAKRGYQVLHFYHDGSIWLDIYAVDKITGIEKHVYRQQIEQTKKGASKGFTKVDYPTPPDSLSTIPSTELKAGAFKRFFLGEQYRDTWETEIKVPTVDLAKLHGGMTPLKLGGGKSSNSLRMESADGKQYILRSVNKDYYKLIPDDYKNIVWVKIYADQNASAVPYGAVTIPKLSDAIGIPHTNPKLVYLTHQVSLGAYNELMQEGLYILEKRPAGEAWSDDTDFDNSPKIIGYNDLLEKLNTKRAHVVDQKAVLKARLFDMWIHDWDRHDDQWRWERSDEGDLKVYRPIPRDRDWIYYKYEGLIYQLAARFVMRKFRTMDTEIKDIIGLNMSAAHFDRSFLNELSWEDWQEITQEVQAAISEELIDEALAELPPESHDLLIPEIKEKLLKRWKDLDQYAKAYFDILYKEVDIVGTDGKDHFTITGADNNSIEITHIRTSKKKKDVLRYQRIFDPNKTDEIHIFGRGDNDILEYHAHSPIAIHFIGGEGDDEIINTQLDSKTAKLTVYDDNQGVKLTGINGIKTIFNDELSTNNYDRLHFKYDSTLPKLTFGYTYDDGLWFGGGFTRIKHGFRQEPYEYKHDFNLSFGTNSRSSVQLDYSLHMPEILNSKWGVKNTIFIHYPNYVNFFGFDNELSTEDVDVRFNTVRFNSYGADIMLHRANRSESIQFNIGTYYESHEIEIQDNRIAEVYDFFTEKNFERDHYLGLRSSISMASKDNELSPKFGFEFDTQFSYQYRLNDDLYNGNFHISLNTYTSLSVRPEIVLANRVGYDLITGNSEWYQLPSLGNDSNIRSLRNNRYRGDAVFYHMIDLRLKLFDWNNRIIPMTIGATGGFDYGRYFGGSDNNYYHGYATGLSFNVFDLFIFHPYMSFGQEENLFILKSGYAF